MDRPGGYEPHFGLAESPFTLTSNPRFLFESASHLAALQEVAYALPRNEPIIVVTGAIGTGKTTLCRIIAERRGPRSFVATISTPPTSVDDLLRLVLDGFNVLTDDTSRVVQASHYGLLRTLQQFLGSLVALNAQAIIVFDEAQHLSPDMLEQIRLLSNIDVDSRKLLQIILVGQPELEDVLARDDLRQLAQRVSRRHRLGPLERHEVGAYVDRRIRVAQSGEQSGERRGHPPEFTAAAIRAIGSLSAGVPRIINTLCDRSLERAWSQQTHTIDAATIVHAGDSLGLPVPWTLRIHSSRRAVRVAAVVAGLAVAALLWSVRGAIFRPASSPREPSTTVRPQTDAASAAATRSMAADAAAPAGVPPPADAPSTATSRVATSVDASVAESFLVLVSSFRTADRAAAASREIAALGLPASTRSVSDWQQVVVGPYASREEAATAQARLEKARVTGTLIVSSGPPRVETPLTTPAR